MAVGTMRRAGKHSPTPSELVSLPTRIFVRCRRPRDRSCEPRGAQFSGRSFSFSAIRHPAISGRPRRSSRPRRSRRTVRRDLRTLPPDRWPCIPAAARRTGRGKPRSSRQPEPRTLAAIPTPAIAWPEPSRRLDPPDPKACRERTAAGPDHRRSGSISRRSAAEAAHRRKKPQALPEGFALRPDPRTSRRAAILLPASDRCSFRRFPPVWRPKAPLEAGRRPLHRRRTRRPASSAEGPEGPSASDRCGSSSVLARPRRTRPHPSPSPHRRKRVPCHSAPASERNNKFCRSIASKLCISGRRGAIRRTIYSPRYPHRLAADRETADRQCAWIRRSEARLRNPRHAPARRRFQPFRCPKQLTSGCSGKRI
jgi:hypothetical protein